MINPWKSIRDKLQTKLTSESFQNWVSNTRFHRVEESTLYVGVPNDATRDWLEQEYAPLIEATIRHLGLPIRSVVYELDTHAAQEPAPVAVNDYGSSDLGATTLNPRYTFDNFVVGACNQIAHAAAKAVAEEPACSYNPLFIYGDTGMGKTHLMHAIGHVLHRRYSGMRVVYVSSERFMNELISCIRLDRMREFHMHYRSADILLMDDVHILGKKERTQEEFFHTFNELFEQQKQIVISSDSSPKEITGLVERLRSRFEWGLMVDMQAPDLETKLAILDKKAEQQKIQLPDNIRILLATRTKSSVRELEGALIKLLAYSSLSGCPITLPMAQQVLKSIGTTQDRRVTIETIIRTVAEKFDLSPADLRRKSNLRTITTPRQIAMYLAKELTLASLPEIGRAFHKHHTTVLHSVRIVEERRRKDPELARMIQGLVELLQ